jgi:hypothetical protein
MPDTPVNTVEAPAPYQASSPVASIPVAEGKKKLQRNQKEHKKEKEQQCIKIDKTEELQEKTDNDKVVKLGKRKLLIEKADEMKKAIKYEVEEEMNMNNNLRKNYSTYFNRQADNHREVFALLKKASSDSKLLVDNMAEAEKVWTELEEKSKQGFSLLNTDEYITMLRMVDLAKTSYLESVKTVAKNWENFHSITLNMKNEANALLDE